MPLDYKRSPPVMEGFFFYLLEGFLALVFGRSLCAGTPEDLINDTPGRMSLKNCPIKGILFASVLFSISIAASMNTSVLMKIVFIAFLLLK